MKEERSQLLLEMIRKYGPSISQDKINRYTKLTENTDFVDVRVYLMQIKEEYSKCIGLYLMQSTPFKRRKLFNWLNDTIPPLKEYNNENYKLIKDTILSKLTEIVVIDSDLTRKMILTLGQEMEIEAIRRLQPFEYLQLEYLKGILSQRDIGLKIDDDLLVLHLKLLCKLKPREVIREVRKYNYPLEECLKICREENVLDALALFTERVGNYMEALEISIRQFKITVDDELTYV